MQHSEKATIDKKIPRTANPVVRAMLDEFAAISLKHDFSTEEVALMERIWRHTEAHADRSNFICAANVSSNDSAEFFDFCRVSLNR